MSFSTHQRLFLNVSVMALLFLGTLTGVSLAAARSPGTTASCFSAAASLTTDEAPLLAIARAAVSTLVEQLFALSSSPAPSTTVGARLAELKALAGALE